MQEENDDYITAAESPKRGVASLPRPVFFSFQSLPIKPKQINIRYYSENSFCTNSWKREKHQLAPVSSSGQVLIHAYNTHTYNNNQVKKLFWRFLNAPSPADICGNPS